MRKTLKPPGTFSLSLANIEASAVMVEDWTEAYSDERLDIIYPRPTYAALSDYAEDIMPARRPKDSDTPLPDALADEFEQTDGVCEWRDAFFPMMSYYWPVVLAYKVDAQEAASLIDRFAPACTLVRLDSMPDDEYGIALSGGGMNLADHLAIAYLCCGSVPPSELLLSLPGVIEGRRALACRAALADAFKTAIAWHKSRAERLAEDATRVAAKAKPESINS